MLLSVIIPCYKNASTLAKAIDSVLSQTQQVDEVIVVNDASPESLQIEAVISNYPSVRYIVNPSNLGLAASRNIGVEVSEGDLISFLDADDWLHPQKIELQCAIYRDGIAVSCNHARFKYDDELETEVYPPSPKVRVYSKLSDLAFANRVTGASVLISKRDFWLCQGYDQSLLSCEDYDLSLRLLSSDCKIVNIELPLYFYRDNPSSLSNDLSGILDWQIRVLKKNFSTKYASNFAIDILLSVWILKHMVRSEACFNYDLHCAIKRSISTSIQHSFLRFLLIIVLLSRVGKVVYWLIAARNRFLL